MTTAAAPAGPRRAGGRPTREQAAQLDEDVRAAALALFLEHGYDGTSMDAIAAAAATTKATLYARYPSKEALFRAVLEWAMSRKDWPVREPPPPDPRDLRAALHAIARAAVRRALDPAMVKLSRIAVAQAERFPDLAAQTHAHPTWPRRRLVADLLEQHAATGAIVLPAAPELVADLFLGLVSSVPARLASFGVAQPPAAVARHIDTAVEIFLRSFTRPAL